MSLHDEIMANMAMPVLYQTHGDTFTHVNGSTNTPVTGIFKEHKTEKLVGEDDTRIQRHASMLVSVDELASVTRNHSFIVNGESWGVVTAIPKGNDWHITLTRKPTEQVGSPAYRGRK